MKKITTTVCMAMLFVALLSSCASSKQTAINDLRTLEQDIELNGSQYTINDWKDVASQYASINKKIKSHTGDYTDEEMEEISTLNGKCIGAFTKGAVSKVQGAVSSIKSLIGGIIEQVTTK